MPVEHLKVFLAMGFSFGKLIEALGDGFQLLQDLKPIVESAKAVPGGIAAAPQALSEYLQMTDEEALSTEEWAVATFDLKNDNVEAAIEAALKLVIDLHALARLVAPKGA